MKIASAIALSSLLVACGGGGSTPPSDQSGVTDQTGLVTSAVKGVDVTVTSYNSGATTSISSQAVTQAPVFSSVSSLGLFTLNDSYGKASGQISFNTGGITAGNFFQMTSGAQAFSLGGTSWSYARFGMFKNTVNASITSNGTAQSIRHTPFFVADVSSGVPSTDAVYATKGLAVGVMSTSTTKTGVTCQASAAYTHSSKAVVVTLSSCFSEGTPSNPVPVSGTIALNPTGATLSGFAINDGVALTANSVLSSGYKFGGPTGEELVGAATVSGPAGFFTFAFGAKK